MRFIFLILPFILVSTLWGQEAPKKSDVLLRFTMFGATSQKQELVMASGEKRSAPFFIRGNGFSEGVALPSSQRQVILGIPSEVDVPAEQEPAMREVTRFVLPEEGKRFLVILVAVDKGSFRSIVVRGDEEGFRPGQILFINLANEDFGAELGEKKLRFKKNSRTIFKPVKEDDNLANYQMRMFALKDGEPSQFAASLWPYLERKRAYVFLFRDPKTKKPSYRSVDEFTGWLE